MAIVDVLVTAPSATTPARVLLAVRDDGGEMGTSLLLTPATAEALGRLLRQQATEARLKVYVPGGPLPAGGQSTS